MTAKQRRRLKGRRTWLGQRRDRARTRCSVARSRWSSPPKPIAPTQQPMASLGSHCAPTVQIKEMQEMMSGIAAELTCKATRKQA